MEITNTREPLEILHQQKCPFIFPLLYSFTRFVGRGVVLAGIADALFVTGCGVASLARLSRFRRTQTHPNLKRY